MIYSVNITIQRQQYYNKESLYQNQCLLMTQQDLQE